MTENELQDRITRAIIGRTATAGAQAVIDEFRLTVEQRNTGKDIEDPKTGIITYGVESRVVGRWEEA